MLQASIFSRILQPHYYLRNILHNLKIIAVVLLCCMLSGCLITLPQVRHTAIGDITSGFSLMIPLPSLSDIRNKKKTLSPLMGFGIKLWTRKQVSDRLNLGISYNPPLGIGAEYSYALISGNKGHAGALIGGDFNLQVPLVLVYQDIGFNLTAYNTNGNDYTYAGLKRAFGWIGDAGGGEEKYNYFGGFIGQDKYISPTHSIAYEMHVLGQESARGVMTKFPVAAGFGYATHKAK